MRVTHDPDATLDYTVDWSAWLADDETISESAWLVPTGLIAGVDSHDDATAWVWISGGTAGVSYTITNRVTTSAGRTDDRSIALLCRER